MMIRALVVEDEPLLARELANALGRLQGIQVLGTCLDGPDAVVSIRDLKPDVVFLDIQMPGLDGFQVLEELDEDQLPLVVFVTAYDQYALQAFAVHAVDYLLKPISDGALGLALERVGAILQARRPREASQRVLELLERIEGGRSRLGRFVVKEGTKVRFLKTEEVEAIEATGKYMHLHCQGRSHMIRETMGTLEERLDPRRFIRTHRSWIVAIDRISEVHTESDGTFLLRLQSGRQVPVSRHFHEPIQRLLRSPLT